MLQTVTFAVIGDQRLVCEGCEQRVERLRKARQGVGQVRARARNQRIDVLFDTPVLEPSTVAAQIRMAGYETKVGNSGSDPAPRSTR